MLGARYLALLRLDHSPRDDLASQGKTVMLESLDMSPIRSILSQMPNHSLDGNLAIRLNVLFERS